VKNLQITTSGVGVLFSFICPMCGAAIYVKTDVLVGTCEYCGVTSALPRELKKTNKEVPKQDGAKQIHDSEVESPDVKAEKRRISAYAIALVDSIPRATHEGRLIAYSEGDKFNRRLLRLLNKKYTLRKNEYPIILFDSSLQKDGGTGFLITTRSLYNMDTHTAGKYDLRTIRSVIYNKGFLGFKSVSIFVYKSEYKLNTITVESDTVEKLAGIVNTIYMDFR